MWLFAISILMPFNQTPGYGKKIELSKITQDPPFEKYVQVKKNGFSFFINPEVAKDKKLFEEVISSADRQTKYLVEKLPPHVLKLFRSIRSFIETNKYSEEWGGAQYLQATEFADNVSLYLRENKGIIQKVNSVEFHHALSFSKMTEPVVMLHEFGHAYHYKVLPQAYQNIPVRLAFEQAKGRNIYKEKSYCMNNEREYFADLTAVFFVPKFRDYFTTTVEFKEKDPQGFSMILKAYSLKDPTIQVAQEKAKIVKPKENK